MITPAAGVFNPRKSVDDRIRAYRPRDAPAAWPQVAEDVRAMVSKADPLLPYQASEMLSVLARLALFCHGQGVSDRSVWLDPQVVEWFLAVGCQGLSSHTRATYRARLRRLRTALGSDAEAKPLPLAASSTRRPYTAAQQSLLWSCANHQPTQRLRDGLSAVLTLGLGAGLSTEEMIGLTGGQVFVGHDGEVEVNVTGRRGRRVVCHHRWEQHLAGLAERVGSAHVVLPGAIRGKNLVTNLIARASTSPATPEWKVSRLRDTWLAEHVIARIPPTVLITAAGLDSLSSVDPLLPYLPAVDAADAARFLRGAH